jgi:acyl-CoA hydrolase
MELLNSHPIKKSDLGFHGNLFGGKLLAWIDASAAGYAMQLCDTARESQLLKIYGQPAYVGHTSVTLYMEARAHNVYTGKQVIVLRTNIKFVHIDEEGNPIPIGEKGKNRITKLIEKNNEDEKNI